MESFVRGDHVVVVSAARFGRDPDDATEPVFWQHNVHHYGKRYIVIGVYKDWDDTSVEVKDHRGRYVRSFDSRCLRLCVDQPNLPPLVRE